LKNRDKPRSKRHDADGPATRRATPRTAGWFWAALIACAALAGLLVLNASRSARKAPAAPVAGAPSSAGVTNAPAPLSPQEQERALRAEQLQAAQTLAAAFPGNDDAVYLLGLVHNDQGDSATAIKFWERALELDASRADANDSLGHALLLRDDYEKAEAYFRRALELDPTLPTANFRLATTLVHQGKVREAAAILERASSLSAEGHRLLGEAYQHLREFDKAKASFEKALQLKPDFAEAHYGLSRVLGPLGETEKSREQFEKFSALKAQANEAARRLRSNFDTLGNTRRSVPQSFTDVGRVYMTQRRAREAEEFWLKAVALDPTNTLCRLQLAVLYQQTAKHSESLRFYEEVARIDPNDGLVHLNMGRVALKLDRLDRAEQAFREVIRLEPARPEGHSALAQLYLQTNKDAVEAVRLAETAVRLEPEAKYFALLGQARAGAGDRRGALAAIDRAIELQPGNGQYLQLRAALSGRP
jgi:tetratricopeptide (TPR) repeat protein